MSRPGSAFMQGTHPGLQCAVPSQAAAGYQLSREALLVGTVAALQEESGQMRHEWKTDVARLENELQQLRSAAAMALPHVRTENVLPPEANFRLLSNPAPTDTCSNISGRDAAALQGMFSDHAIMGRNLSQQSHSSYNPGLQNSVQIGSSLESLLAERSGHGLLAREAAQLDAVMLQGSVKERAGRDYVADAPSFQRSRAENQGTNLAEAVLSQMRAMAAEPSPARGSVSKEFDSSKEAANQSALIKDLYMELERMTVALQEVEQENNKLKEEKETSINAHSRDISALEGMLQQLTAENKVLSKQLGDANAKLQRLQMDGLDPDIIRKLKQCSSNLPSTPTSIRSASIEPATEPDVDSLASSVELDKLRIKIGLHS